MRTRKLMAAAWLAAIGCSDASQRTTPDAPPAIDECQGLPGLTLSASREQTRVNTAITLHADGGSGRYSYALEPGGSGGELRADRLITGATPASDHVSASDDCGNSASISIAVVGGFGVAPARASVRPGTAFTIEVSGNLGAPQCAARDLGSGGSIGGDCAYVAGSGEGLDVITVRDSGSGDELAVQYQVANDAGLAFAPARLALPHGASVTLHTAGGSDTQTFKLVSGPGRLDGAVYTAAVSGEERTAVIEAEDRFTHETARTSAQVMRELGDTDKAHGRLTDLASLVTGDFDGDGVDDVALGVPESDLGKPNGGAVFIFRGSQDGLPAQPTWTLTGETDTANLGAVLAAGDLNGDGHAELAISEPGADITVADSGAVLIYTWSDGKPVLLRPALTGTGPSKFGAALAIADVDGDGDSDLVVGSPSGDLAATSTMKERGTVDVFLLQPKAAIPDYANLRIGGADLGADGKTLATSSIRFGRGLAIGDYNGDGRADLANLGSVNNASASGMPVAKNQPAIAIHFGRGGAQPFAATADVYIAPMNPADSNEGTYRLFTAPAADGGRAQRLLVAADRLDAPDFSAQGGNKAASDAGGVYIYDLSGGSADGDAPALPKQLGRDDAFARVYGDVAGGVAARSVSLVDIDGDDQLELLLGAPFATRQNPDKTSAALTGKVLVYPYRSLTQGAQLAQPSAARWGQGAIDTLGVAIAAWSPGPHGVVAFAGRASTDAGNFTGRLDAYLGTGALADRPAQAAPLHARLASQQRGAAVQLAVIDDEVKMLVGVPGFSGLGAKNDGDDVGAGQTLLFSPNDDSARVLHEGSVSAHMAGDHAAYGGRLTGSDVTVTDFDGDGRADLVVAAPQLSTPTAMTTDYASVDMKCVASSAQTNGGALVFLAQANGDFTPGFRAFALADIAGCTPAGDAKCKRKDLSKSGIAGGFDFDGDGKQDLLLTRANGLEVFLGRARGGDGKPSMACDPVFSLPALAQTTSAPAALGDLDADGCDEVAVRYSDSTHSGVLIAFGFAADGGKCKGHNQAAWLRVSGDAEAGLSNMQLGIASARAGAVFGDGRDWVAMSANLYPFEGTRQPAVLLFDAKALAAKRPASGEAVIGALDPSFDVTPLVYRDRAPGFGRALAGNVDLDGDGVVDLVVSAPGASLNGDGTGAVFAFRGSAAFGGRMDAWLTIASDQRERASLGQDLSVIPATSKTPASLAIGAPLSYRTGTANGTAWLLQLDD